MAEEADETNMTTISDTLLLEKIESGDTASFETLFYRHYDRIYGLLFRLLGNRVEAEDMTQETFMKLYHHSFQGQREHHVGAWLYRVATNLGYNHIRSRKRRWQRNRLLVPDEMDDSADPARQAARKETQLAVRSALAQLSERQTQLLLLRQMGLSYAELAEACGVAPGSVGTLLRRAATAFREVYEEGEEHHE